MASSDKELEEQLFEAGNKLLDPPRSVDELLPLLDQVESCLSRVEQSPSKSMQKALSPSLKALIADNLLKHSDADVKVAVASCISEITRITAPEAPYDDDQMKEVFQLIVSSFENLSDKSSRSYAKRTSILETVAKVRSCVVMLDLECDALILQMFQHFFKTIREHHPENVFSSMETIMTLVIEESEELSIELLSPVLASVKKDNEEVLPIARKLGERVLESCANKFKPYIIQTVKTLGISLDDYSEVLASICQEKPGSVEQSDACATSELAAQETKLSEAPLEELTQVVNVEEAREAASAQVNPVGDESPKSVMSNGIAEAGQDDSHADTNTKSLKKQEGAHPSDHSRDNSEPDKSDTEKVDSTVQKPEQATKRKGRKHNSSVKPTDPSESPAIANEKETEKLADSKGQSKDIPSSAQEDQSVEVAGPSENDNDAKISSPKAVDAESKAVASPSPSEGLLDENRSKKSALTKKKSSSAKVEMQAGDASKKVSEGASDSEAKLNRHSSKKAPVISDSEAKKQLTKKADGSNKKGDRSSLKQVEDKKRGRGKATSETAAGKSSAKDEDKEMVSSPKSGTELNKEKQSEETPKTNLKRRHTPGKDDSDSKEYGENLVGLRVKVWWPKDRMFYRGVIDSFDPVKKKHKVSYDDGDEEILNLRREKWQSIGDDSDLDGEEESDRAKPEASDIPPKKKGKTSAGDSTKQGKIDASSRSGATSSKSKVPPKDGSKSKDSKTVGKLEDNVNKKSKDDTPKSGSNKSVEKISSKSKNTETPKMSKSKDEDASTPKGSAKSKQETPRTGKSKKETSSLAASKGKKTKSGGKSNVNDTDNVKSGSSKTKVTENENSEDSTKVVEDTKAKTPNSSKALGSEAKSGKKRRRT